MTKPIFCFCLLISVVGSCWGAAWLEERKISLLGKTVDEALQELRSTSAGSALSKDTVDPVDPPEHIAGYFHLNGTKDAHMFYWFFESRTSKDTSPLILWTNGGPGCSSSMGVFFEQGPYVINDDLTLSLRETSWDITNNMIFIDQPTGTGFSYSKSSKDVRHSSQKGVAADVTMFMQLFYEKHPEMANRDLYVTGESYAGHYVPAIAFRMTEVNKAGKGPHIPLVGIGIGNGLTNPKIQYGAYADYAADNGIISESRRDSIKSTLGACTFAIDLCAKFSLSCYIAKFLCESTQFTVITLTTGINHYDIRKKCENPPLCYDFSAMTDYLNQRKVQKELGVRKQFVECNRGVYSQMMGDWMHNYEDDVAKLLADGIRVLIYAGNKDFICNWLGNRRWVDTLDWAGAKEWLAGKDFDWNVKGKYAGKAKETKGMELVFVQVDEAGHMVPMDQPENGYDMIERFIHKKSFSSPAPLLEQLHIERNEAAEEIFIA